MACGVAKGVGAGLGGWLEGIGLRRLVRLAAAGWVGWKARWLREEGAWHGFGAQIRKHWSFIPLQVGRPPLNEKRQRREK